MSRVYFDPSRFWFTRHTSRRCWQLVRISGWIALAVALQHPAHAATIFVEGACTLVKAIEAANTDSSGGDCIAGSGADVIELSADVTLSTVYLGNDGLPAVTSQITIEGGGWTVERAGGPTQFRIFHVLPGGDLTLRSVSVENGRVTTSASEKLGGGGILNQGGVLKLYDSTVSGCQVEGDGWFGAGGGILNDQFSTLEVSATTISTNAASSDTHDAAGGGIFASGAVTITTSTISGNYAISTASSGLGGGLHLLTATGLIRHVTFSGNAADSVSGGGSGSALLASDGITVRGSILANSLFGLNCSGTPELVDGTENQADDDSCSTIPDTLTGLDPVLRDNGGPTRTHALLPGSSALLGAPTCGLAKDQRGAPRGFFCDSGSFEWGGCPEVVLSDDTVLGPEVHESCQISAGPNYCVIGPFGNLTLRGGREIRLGEGFCVGLDAVLTLEIDADLIP